MKVKTFLLFLYVVFQANINIIAEEGNSKYALIIGIANYPKNTGWNPISSNNDVIILEDALLRQGFKKENITIITDSDANKDGIMDQLEILQNKVNTGDIVVIHFSGHGQQVIDDNGDEPDGYDESLIPFDAQIRYSNNYRGENHLRDDEFKTILTTLRYKLGKKGNILVILDSCHSGTGTRGFQKSRGTQVKFGSNEQVMQECIVDKRPIDFDEFSVNNVDEVAPLVTFSASGPEQLNYEFTNKETETSYGSLSFAFCKALINVDSTTTYRGLFDRILVEMNSIAPKQNPQAEGDLDQLLFDGQTIKVTPYFKIIDEFGINEYSLSGGNLHGIYEGTEVGLYDIDTYNFVETKPKAVGTIINSTMLTSTLQIEGDQPLDEVKNKWAYVINQTFGENAIQISLAKVKDKKQKKMLGSFLETKEEIILNNDAPDIIIEDIKKNTTDSLLFYTKDEFLLASYYTTEKSNQQIEQIVSNEIKKYFQANFLRRLNLSTSEFDVTFKIIPITLKSMGSGYIEDEEISLKEIMNISNQVNFTEGSAFKISIKSNGYNKAFYQILDIQPDNKINILIPTDNNEPSDYIIYPGEEIELSEIFVIGKPYGKEIFKLIATSEPIDLSMIINTRGQGTPEKNSPFEILFRDTYNPTRGASLAIQPETVSTYTFAFEIVE